MSTISQKLDQVSIDKTDIRNAIEAKKGSALADPNNCGTYATEIDNLPSGGSDEWVRPSEWIPLNEPATPSTEQISALYFIYPDNTTIGTLKIYGDYTVDWGDGSPTENGASGTFLTHTYDWATISASTLLDNEAKQVVITITPQSGSNFTRILSIGSKYPDYMYPVDIVIGGDNFTTMNSAFKYIETLVQCRILGDTSSISDFYYMFGDDASLRYINTFDVSSATTAKNIFQRTRLTDEVIKNFNFPASCDLTSAHDNCTYITVIPPYLGTSSTATKSYIGNYNGIKKIVYDVPNWITAEYAFKSEFLQYLKLTSTSNITSLKTIVANIGYELKYFYIEDTSNVTDFYGMVQSRDGLEFIHITEINEGANTTNMFQYCKNVRQFEVTKIDEDVNLFYMKLSREQLVDIFTNVLTDRTATTAKTLTITNVLGTPDLTAADIQIATDKNWTITT